MMTARARFFFAAVWSVAIVLAPAFAIAQDTAGVGIIRGTVADSTGAAVPDVAICIPSIGRCEVSDARGTFAIADLRPGRYDVEVTAAGQPPLVSAVTVRAGFDAVLEVSLPGSSALTDTITVTAPVFVVGEEVTTSAFVASGAEILEGAGALQDVSRFVQTRPGAVIGTDDFRNDLIVRGGSPLENLYIVDNVEIPNINTFANFASAGGTVSMVDAALIEDVTFLTGGFPAAYGQRASSVLQVALREGNRERTGVRATVGFAGAGGVIEGPIAGGRGSFIVSARRSVLDAITNDTGIGGVPVLYTANAKVLLDITARDRIWLLNVSGFDRIRLGAGEKTDPASELSNLDITYRGTRHATGFNWQRTFGSSGVGLFGVTYARAGVRQRIGDLIRDGLPPQGASVADQIADAQEVFRESSSEADLTIKYDLTAYAGLLGKIQAGGYARRTTTNYDAASPFGNEGPFFADPATHPFAIRDTRVTNQGGGYAQLSTKWAGRIGITAGLRADRFGASQVTRVAPRLGARVDIAPALSLRLAAGRFYQQPFLVFVTAFPANAGLRPFHADHVVAGMDFTPRRDTRITLEAYEKRYRDYPVSADVPQLSLANVGDTFAVRDVLFPMVSAGTGRSRGIELFAERKASSNSPWHGQMNLAVSRTRYAGRDGVPRPGSFDYPVVANATGTYRIGTLWSVSTRVSYLAGRPYTPFDIALSTTARRGIYQLDRVNDARVPDYFRIDLRIDRTWMVKQRPLSIFAGAQNVTNRLNVSGYSWDRRNSGVRIVEQLRVFPIVGIDWQF